ncbi:arsenate reductase ArsC [Amylibacter sp. SFDW26]|uniref:arsenate reductase ArsC n=1 Tax=Amylibacter sp. SFDW26 TaxID=2652722 RepID=UPI001261B7A8|nr:arsenate reductase ArsC [Amylibacter sp. SFDW26]KAB7615767.1 arsenate reductase ArsC [Amylibacter sp. SFDW26]
MKILVLCTGNSARSILLESIFNAFEADRITAYSAGSKPVGKVNPAAVAHLATVGIDASTARSKSWNEFSGDDAPHVDLVITVCGNARNEECPYWPGAPLKAHWGVEDPADVTEPPEAVAAAFAEAYKILHHRATALLALPFEDMSSDELQKHLIDIGDITP